MLPSFSKLDRLKACAATESFPPTREPSGKPAIIGQHVHKYLEEKALKVKFAEALLESIPIELHGRCSNIDLDGRILNRFMFYQPETAFALHLSTGTARQLPTEDKDCNTIDGRESVSLYRGEDEIAGIVDLWGRLHNGILCVMDYKTGRSIGPVKKSMQMRAGALALARTHGESSVVACVVYIGLDGELDIDQCLFADTELDEIESELREVFVRYHKAEEMIKNGLTPPLTIGDHCRYCVSKLVCPAQMTLAREMSKELLGLDESIAALSTVQMGELYIKINAMLLIVEHVKKSIQNVAYTHLIPTSNGKALQVMRGARRSNFSQDRAMQLLRELGATPEQIADLTTHSYSSDYIRELKIKNKGE